MNALQGEETVVSFKKSPKKQGKNTVTSDSSLCNAPLDYFGLAYAICCMVVLSGEMIWNGLLLNVLHLIYVFVI